MSTLYCSRLQPNTGGGASPGLSGNAWRLAFVGEQVPDSPSGV